jgi:hypothetical protein
LIRKEFVLLKRNDVLVGETWRATKKRQPDAGGRLLQITGLPFSGQGISNCECIFTLIIGIFTHRERCYIDSGKRLHKNKKVVFMHRPITTNGEE